MGWNEPDVYYQPEKFDLTPVAEIEYSSGYYEFDTRVVWRHKDGTLYTGRDSGCSCPIPWETFTSLDTLDKADIPALIKEAEAERDQGAEYGWAYPSADDVAAFITKLREEERK